MMREVYDHAGLVRVRVEEADPVCGEHFCDRCGDCLRCYGGDPCYDHPLGVHRWIQYGEDE